jgi:hypothetical protein
MSPASTRFPFPVREQNRHVLAGLDARRIDGHHIGPVGEIGDAAETLGLALRAIGRARAVKAHELRVGGGSGGIEQCLDREAERTLRRLRDRQPVGRGEIAVCAQRFVIKRDRNERETVAVEHERSRCPGIGVWLEQKRRAHARRRRVERDVEVDGFHQPIGGAIVGKADRAGFFCTHGRLPDVGAFSSYTRI